MDAGWVAGSVRARALAQRRLGAANARRIAASGSLREAQRALSGTAYGDQVRPGQDLAATQREIASALLWDLRVLAGWLPPDGVRRLRVLAAWFELANVDEMLQGFAGQPAEAQFQLGGLATAWPRLRQAGDRVALRAALAGTDWRDPGGDSDRALRLGLRMRYAARGTKLGGPGVTRDT
jgi:vacuolar-type H+-ATPase subunit C/Vma6